MVEACGEENYPRLRGEEAEVSKGDAGSQGPVSLVIQTLAQGSLDLNETLTILPHCPLVMVSEQGH